MLPQTEQLAGFSAATSSGDLQTGQFHVDSSSDRLWAFGGRALVLRLARRNFLVLGFTWPNRPGWRTRCAGAQQPGSLRQPAAGLRRGSLPRAARRRAWRRKPAQASAAKATCPLIDRCDVRSAAVEPAGWCCNWAPCPVAGALPAAGGLPTAGKPHPRAAARPLDTDAARTAGAGKRHDPRAGGPVLRAFRIVAGVDRPALTHVDVDDQSLAMRVALHEINPVMAVGQPLQIAGQVVQHVERQRDVVAFAPVGNTVRSTI